MGVGFDLSNLGDRQDESGTGQLCDEISTTKHHKMVRHEIEYGGGDGAT